MDPKKNSDEAAMALHRIQRRDVVTSGALLAGAGVFGPDAFAHKPGDIEMGKIELRDWAGYFANTKYFGNGEKTAGVYLPSTNDQVSRLVKIALETGKKVRAVGLQSGMEASWYGGPGSMMVSTQKLVRKEGPVFTTARGPAGQVATVTVGAGVRMDDLLKAAWEKGYSIDSAPAPGWMSVGGCIATASHGSGMGSLSSIMLSCTYVNGKGDVRTVSAGDPELEALRQSIGLIGIITEVTIKLVKAFNLRMIGGRILTSEWAKYLPDGSFSFVQVQPLSLVPTKPGETWSRYFFTERTDKEDLGTYDQNYKKMEGVFYTGYVDFAVEGPAFEVAMNFQPPNLPISGAEYCIPMDRFQGALDEMMAEENIRKFPPVYWLKKVGREPGHLSNSDGPSVWCGLYNIVSGENHGDNLNSRNEVLLAAAEKIMVKAGGRPHIGKMMRSPEILRNFSEKGMAKFLEIREAEDPDRLFLPEYLQKIFSL